MSSSHDHGRFFTKSLVSVILFVGGGVWGVWGKKKCVGGERRIECLIDFDCRELSWCCVWVVGVRLLAGCWGVGGGEEVDVAYVAFPLDARWMLLFSSVDFSFLPRAVSWFWCIITVLMVFCMETLEHFVQSLIHSTIKRLQILGSYFYDLVNSIN